MQFDIDSDHTREVYARFGLAYYQTSCLEKQMAVTLGGPGMPMPDMTTRGRSDEIFDMHLDETFGVLANKIKDSIPLPQDISQKLETAIRLRNWLAHFYWWDRASEFTSTHGQLKMIHELAEMTDLFVELDEYLMGITVEWARKRGPYDVEFAAALEELLSGPTPPRYRKRRLLKSEKLINVYMYSIEREGKTVKFPVFELEDHTLCTLCDNGLTGASDEIDRERLNLIQQYLPYLPATINPKPKRAQNWNYRIPLNNGFCIVVHTVTDEGKSSIRWRLSKI